METIAKITLTDFSPGGAPDEVTTTTAGVEICRNASQVVVGLGDCRIKVGAEMHWPLEVRAAVVRGKLEISVYDMRHLLGKMPNDPRLADMLEVLEGFPLAEVTVLPKGRARVWAYGTPSREVQVKCL